MARPVDRVEELLPNLDCEPLLRSGSSASFLIIAVRAAAPIAPAPGVPACVGAMPDVGHTQTLLAPSAIEG
jgi:hypothetical protein